MKNFLGVIGGVGPLSTAYFYTKLITQSKASCDQDYIDMIILNHSSIPDRTDYILSKSDNSPLPDLISDVKFLSDSGSKIIAIPCNTACYFYDEIKNITTVPILNIIEETAIYLHNKNIKTVGILATNGTIESNLYQNICSQYNINCIILDEILQEKVMTIIYDQIKIGKLVNKEEFLTIGESLIASGAEKIVLGCTELSILKEQLSLDNNYVDPIEILISKILKVFNKEENDNNL